MALKVVFNPFTAKFDYINVAEYVNDVQVFTAGENIGGGKVVYIAGGQAFLYTADDELLYRASIGLSVGAAVMGADVEVQISGIFTEVGLGLTPDEDYFADVNGLLTTNPDGLKVCQYVGRAITPDKIKIEFQLPIITI